MSQTWILNSNCPMGLWGRFGSSLGTFTSNNTIFTSASMDEAGEEEWLYYDSIHIATSTNFTSIDSWVNEAYRTITFETAPTGDLLTWLQTNATLQDVRVCNKVVYGETTLIDLTSDTIEASNLLSGYSAHDKSGATITGTCDYDANTSDGTANASEILSGETAYVDGSKVTGTMTNNGSVSGTISTKAGTYSIPVGFHDGGGSVGIDSTEQAKIISSNIKKDISILGVTGTYEGTTPSGTLPVTENGTYDVTNYASAVVNVSGGGGYDLTSTYTCTVTNNGSSSVELRWDSDVLPSNFGVTTASYHTLAANQTYTLSTKTNLLYIQGMSVSTYATSGSVTHIISNQNQYIYIIQGDSVLVLTCSCFLPDTLITLSDGTTKQVKDITYNDKLKVWNFDEGKYDEANVIWLTQTGLQNNHYYKTTFSDGTIVKFTGHNSNHKVYSVDECYFKGVNKLEVGDRIFSENGIVTVVSNEYIEEDCEYYNLITDKHINCFANGILAADRYGNLYPINSDMTYNKEGRTIRPYSDFETVDISYYWYEHLRLGEVNDTIDGIKAYIGKLECQMRDKELYI